jgi:hypothetical protein
MIVVSSVERSADLEVGTRWPQGQRPGVSTFSIGIT